MRSFPAFRVRSKRCAIGALPFVLLAASCSSKTASTSAPAPGPGAAASTVAEASVKPVATVKPGTTSAPPGVGTTVAVVLAPPVLLDKTVWWSPDLNQHGLIKIHFTQAQLDVVSTIPTITLSFTAQNVQHANRFLSFGNESVLTVHGKSVVQPQSNNLAVTSETASDGKLVFQVDPTATIDDAVLTLGDPDSNQSIVPLQPAKAVTTTEPKIGFATGTIHGLDHNIAIGSSIEYADTTLGQKSKSVIALTVKVTYTGTGGGLIGTNNFTLTMPDGATTPGVQLIGEPLDPLIQDLNPGQISPSQLVGFEVDQPVTGNYTIAYTSAAATDQDKPATSTFTIDA